MVGLPSFVLAAATTFNVLRGCTDRMKPWSEQYTLTEQHETRGGVATMSHTDAENKQLVREWNPKFSRSSDHKYQVNSSSTKQMARASWTIWLVHIASNHISLPRGSRDRGKKVDIGARTGKSPRVSYTLKTNPFTFNINCMMY